MSQTNNKVKLFFGLLITPEIAQQEIERILTLEFSAIDLRSPVFPFSYTHYYEQEMGQTIQRTWISSHNLIYSTEIADVKNHCIYLEKYLAREDGTRRVNIDPGYLNLGKVILPTTKDHYHRIYLGNEIYAEVTLHYKKEGKSFQPFEWSYPDYKSPEGLDFFNKLREFYKEQIKETALS